MSAGYVVARENFKEAETHVSADKDPVMFNLLYGLQSLTTQLESDFAAVHAAFAALATPAAKPASTPRPPAKTAAKKAPKAAPKPAAKKSAAGKARRGR